MAGEETAQVCRVEAIHILRRVHRLQDRSLADVGGEGKLNRRDFLGRAAALGATAAFANSLLASAASAQTQVLAARAWVQFAEKHTDDAIALMRRAAELEATADKEAVTPGEVLPAGDLLGDMLLEAGRPTEALAAYEMVLAASPNRLNTLYGAGLAAERAGNLAKARQYYEGVTKVAADGDAGIERIQHAQTFLASR